MKKYLKTRTNSQLTQRHLPSLEHHSKVPLNRTPTYFNLQLQTVLNTKPKIHSFPFQLNNFSLFKNAIG